MQPYPGLEPYAQAVDLPRNGLRLFYFAAGDPCRPAALLLHGLGDEADTWRYLIEPLSQRWRVIAPDLPGFGRSDQPKLAYTFDFLRGCLFELLEVLAVPKALLVGHSLGGMLAHGMLTYGMLAHDMRVEQPGASPPRFSKPVMPDPPETGEASLQVSGLALLDGALLTRTQRLSPQLLLFMTPLLGEYLYTRLRKDPQAAYATLRAYYTDMDKLPQVERDFLFRRVNQRVWSDGQRRAYFSTLRNMASSISRLQKDLPARLVQLHTPTLILWGAQDRVNPPENGSRLAQLQPDSRLVLIPEAGHMPHQERPQEVLRHILGDERF
jgi:pimeloyl-ACP methyl ester carboxylesterase